MPHFPHWDGTCRVGTPLLLLVLLLTCFIEPSTANLSPPNQCAPKTSKIDGDGCYDQDLGKADRRQKGCRQYEVSDCGQTACSEKDDNFNANELCCKCGGGGSEPVSLSEKVKVTALEWLEHSFHTAAQISWQILQMCFFFGLCSLGVWLVSWGLMWCTAGKPTTEKAETETGDAETNTDREADKGSETGSVVEEGNKTAYSCLLRWMTPLATAYLGLVYILYIATVPAFGRPKVRMTETETEGETQGESDKQPEMDLHSDKTKGSRRAGCWDIETWANPGFPHFGPAYWKTKENGDVDTSCFQLVVNTGRLVMNGVAIVLLPYIVLILVMLAIAMAIVTPTVLIFFGLLVVVARIADTAAKLALEGGQTGKVKQEDEEKPKPNPGWFSMLLGSLWSILFRAISISLMFAIDFLVLFSIMVNISFMFPSLSLPVFDIDIFKGLTINIPQFLIDIAIWFKDLFSFLKMPDWELRCQSFNTMSSLFNLFLTALAISVILSSDVVSVVYDRQNRLGSVKDYDDPEASRIKTYWRKLKSKVTKSVVDGSQFLIWQAVTLITNSVSLFIILNFRRLQQEKGGMARDDDTEAWFAAANECTVGMHAISVLITCYIGICTFFYIIRVITGLVYKDGTWILTASLVQEETLFTKASAHRLIAILKLSLGAFLLPGASLGLTKSHIESIRDEFYEKRPAEDQEQGSKDSKVKRSLLKFCPECFCVTTEDDLNVCRDCKNTDAADTTEHNAKNKKTIRHREGCSNSDCTNMLDFFEPKPKYFVACSEKGCNEKSPEDPSTEPEKWKCPRHGLDAVYVKGVYNLTDKGVQRLADLTLDPDDMKRVIQEILDREDKAEHEEGHADSTLGSLVKHLKNALSKVIAFFSARKVLAEALLDLQVQSEKFQDLSKDTIKAEYFRLHDQEFDLSRLSEFRLADFLESSIAAFETRGEHPVTCRLWHLLCMPWGVVRGKQFPTIHTSERCILWGSQVEQVARASGMSYAITIFAVPFIGPFLGKAFMYLNEVPAFVRMGKELRAGSYTYKQSPPDNEQWCKEGSQGLDPSWLLKVLWVFSFLKVIVLYLAVYKPQEIVWFILVVFLMSLISGSFLEKEKRIWKERDELLEGARMTHIRREREHVRRLTEESRAHLRERDKKAKEDARKKWDEEATLREEAEKVALSNAAFRDEVPEYELKPLEMLTFERIRVESCDNIFRQAENIMADVVKLNGKLRKNAVEMRKQVQQRTKDLGAELQKKGAKHQERHPVVKGLMHVFMPSVAGRYAEMLKDAPDIHQETLNSVLQRKISQWRLFLGSLSIQDVNLNKLQQELWNILPDFDIEDIKNNVKNRELDMDVAFMKACSFDVTACFKGQAATIMQQEINLVKAIVEMAVDMLVDVFNFLRQAKDMFPNLAESGKNALGEIAEAAVQEAKDEKDRVAEDLMAAIESASSWMPGTKNLVSKEDRKPEDYSTFPFMLSKQELERRLHDDMEKLEDFYGRIQALCFNLLLVMEAIKAAIDEGKKQLQAIIDSNSGILGCLGAPPACGTNDGDNDEMVLLATEPGLSDFMFTDDDLEKLGAQTDLAEQPQVLTPVESEATEKGNTEVLMVAAEVKPVEAEVLETQDSDKKEVETKGGEEGKKDEQKEAGKTEASEVQDLAEVKPVEAKGLEAQDSEKKEVETKGVEEGKEEEQKHEPF